MHRFSFLGSSHIGFIDELYQKYLQFPDSIEASWRAFFQGYDFARENSDLQLDSDDPVSLDDIPEKIRKEFSVIDLINDYRKRGHLFTETNPVRARRKYLPSLGIHNYGLSEADLGEPFMAAKEVGITAPSSLQEIIDHLQRIYCSSIGIEFVYIRDKEVVKWILSKVHQNDNQPAFTPDKKKRILAKLNEAVGFESFLNTKFVGQKRFSIEGAESLIPALDILIERASDLGVK
jgi:2-oxoglutarate dehydrogenase E1 component